MNRRTAVAWLGTPLGLVLLWLASEIFVSEMPGTALIIGILGFIAVALSIGLFFYMFKE